MKFFRHLKSVFRALSLIALDLAAYYLALFLAVWIRANVIGMFYRPVPVFTFSFSYFASIWWIPLIWIAVNAFEKLYVIRYPFWEEIKTILKSVTVSVLFVLFLVSVRNIFGDISRLTFLLLWVLLAVMTPLVRYWGKVLLNALGIWRENVLVLGAGPGAVETVKGLTAEKQLGYSVIGFLDPQYRRYRNGIAVGRKRFRVFGDVPEFTKFVHLLKVSTIVIAMPHLSREKLIELTTTVQKHVQTVMVVPDLLGIAQINTELHYLFLQKIFLLKIRNNLRSAFNRLVKRSFDIAISLLLLPFLLPVIGIIALLVRRDSRGPAFIVQERLGRWDTVFRCVKFRTMFRNADSILEKHLAENPSARREWKKFKKLRGDDPRVTRIGRFLRKTSLDEIPQIFNVLKGEMSLTGPRPYLPREKSEMGRFTDVILLTTPGITGLWQISGRNELSFAERIKLDTWYVQNWSLWLDFIILFKTAEILVTRKGAY